MYFSQWIDLERQMAVGYVCKKSDQWVSGVFSIESGLKFNLLQAPLLEVKYNIRDVYQWNYLSMFKKTNGH